MLRALLVLGAASASALRLPLAPTRTTTVRCAANPEYDKCVVGSESAAEASDCALPPTAQPIGFANVVRDNEPTDEDKRSMLMGGAESMNDCLSSAENAVEIDECRTDYDELVKGLPSLEKMMSGKFTKPEKNMLQEMNVKNTLFYAAGMALILGIGATGALDF